MIFNEPITVISIYDANKHSVLPYRVKWRSKEYKVNKLGLHYTLREGRKLFHKFAVSTQSADLKLSLDTENLHWTLEEVSDGIGT